MGSTDDSSTGSPQPQLPPGFRFHPTDEELMVHYLKKRASSSPLPVAIITDIDIYKFDPWELPAKATFGEEEWYFFSPRDRKYPNGARPNRAAISGYWKATGTDKPVMTAGGTKKVGVKKALVFYGGRPPKGIKTNWIMHEYRLADNKPNTKPPGCDLRSKKGSLRLDDWVLCRIYKKNNSQRLIDQERDYTKDVFMSFQPKISIPLDLKSSSNYCSLIEDDRNLYEGMNSDYGSVSKAGPQIPLMATAPNNHYSWNEEGNASLLHTKRFLAPNCDGCGISRIDEATTNSIAAILNQQQSMLISSFGEQSYQVSTMNWYS